MKKISKLTYIVFSVYLIFLVWIILFKLTISFDELDKFRNINLIPFYGSVITNGKIYFQEIIENIIIFIPLGIYLSIIKKDWSLGKKVLIALCISLSFEIIQFIFAIGGSDITDLIGNTLGAFIGMGLYTLLNKLFKNKTITIINILGLVLEICFIAFLLLLIISNY